MKERAFGSIVASAVAGLLVMSSANAHEAETADAKAGEAKSAAYCQNATCKGQSACKGHGNASCKGQNGCKGQGFLEAKDTAACKKAGGKWMTK